MPDFFYHAGKPHPIRSSPGYEQAFEGLREEDKKYLRAAYGGAYTSSNPRDERKQRASAAKIKGRVSGPGKILTPEAQDNRFRPKSKSRLY